MQKLNSGYFITAEIKVKEGLDIEKAKKELAKLQELTLTEEGCDFFLIKQNSEKPAHFIMWERFENEQAFKKHFEYEHTKEYTKKNLTEVVQYFKTNIFN